MAAVTPSGSCSLASSSCFCTDSAAVVACETTVSWTPPSTKRCRNCSVVAMCPASKQASLGVFCAQLRTTDIRPTGRCVGHEAFCLQDQAPQSAGHSRCCCAIRPRSACSQLHPACARQLRSTYLSLLHCMALTSGAVSTSPCDKSERCEGVRTRTEATLGEPEEALWECLPPQTRQNVKCSTRCRCLSQPCRQSCFCASLLRCFALGQLVSE